MQTIAKVKPPIFRVSAVIKRADGTIENLGVISETKPKKSLLSILKGRVK